MKQLFIFALLLTGMCFISCGDSDCESFSLNTEIQDELNAFTEAAMVFGNNPTMENCLAYRDAGQDYVDAFAAFRDCAADTGQLSEFNQSLESAQESLDQIMC